MIQKELDTVMQLTGTAKERIAFSDNGFLSRGYVIDQGRIVFKFRKGPDVSYKNEIRILNYVNTLDLGVSLQQVGWKSEDDSYLGLYGVSGQPLEHLSMTNGQKRKTGHQLGLFLKKLHAAVPENAEALPLKDEISAWQERFIDSKAVLKRYFTVKEYGRIHQFVMDNVPEALYMLGEKPVFSHGDLGEGNIYIDEDGKVGVIDFNESGFMEEAADFMDIEDEYLCRQILDSYDADKILRKKVEIRHLVRPMFIIGTYAGLGETAILKHVSLIKIWLEKPIL